jgi:hypothetical protein
MTMSRSLLDFLDAPVLVGDPDGRAVYVNPTFESRFGVRAADATGLPLAELFGGGGREAVLRAVASVCGGEGTVRFRLREGGEGYAALASPIVAERDRVGVVILLTQELAEDERLLAFHREAQEPLDELERCLSELAERAVGPGGEALRDCVVRGLGQLDSLRKLAESLHGLVQGRK